MFGHGPHFHIVGNDETLVAESVAQQVGHDRLGDAGRQIGVQSREGDVRDHDEHFLIVFALDEVLKGLQILFQEFILRAVDAVPVNVRIRLDFANAREMLQGAPDTGLSIAGNGFMGELGHDAGVEAVRPFGLGAEVDDRSEIDIDTQFLQLSPRRKGPLFGLLRLAALSDGLFRRNRRESLAHAQDLAPFLIEGNKRHDAALLADRRVYFFGQMLDLVGPVHIAVE